MDNNVSTESNCITVRGAGAVWWSSGLWLGITSISLMEHNYAVSDTDWLATHNRQYLGRGNLTNNQSNQQLSTLQLALWCKIVFQGFIADGLEQIKIRDKIHQKG